MQPKYQVNGNLYFDEETIPIYVDRFVHDNDVDIHSHSFYEFVYIDQGFSSHYYNQRTTVLTPGDVFGIRPGDVHGYTRPRQTKLYNCLFHREAIMEELPKLKGLPGIGNVFDEEGPSIWHRAHLSPIHRKEVLNSLEKMKMERKERGIGWELEMKSLLIEFLIVVSRTFQCQYEGDVAGEYQYTQYIYAALNYMEEHLSQPIHVEDIAGTIGLSSDYFSRLFKQFTGLTPMEYMKNARLAKAAELLGDPTLSVSQIAVRVGIEDPSYFTRQFKQVFGMSPSQYQQAFKDRET